MRYSNDLRKSVINAYKIGKSANEIVEIFGIQKTAIYDWIKRYKETGIYEAKAYKGGRKPKLTNEQLEEVKEKILAKPDITLADLKQELNLTICISALSNNITKKLKFKYKKNASFDRTGQRRC